MGYQTDRSDTGRLAYPVDQAALLIGVGRTLMWELVRAGTIPTVSIGRRRLVTSDALANYIRGLEQQAAGRQSA